MTIKEKVQAGIKYLNDIHPGWYKKINLNTFDIDDNKNCCIGQLYGDYYKWSNDNNKTLDENILLGLTPGKADIRSISGLNKEWIKQITNMQEMTLEQIYNLLTDNPSRADLDRVIEALGNMITKTYRVEFNAKAGLCLKDVVDALSELRVSNVSIEPIS